MCFQCFQILSEFRCSPSCTRGLVLGSEPVCPPDCFQYKGTLDVFLKVVRQVTKCSFFLYFLSLEQVAIYDGQINSQQCLIGCFRRVSVDYGEEQMQA